MPLLFTTTSILQQGSGKDVWNYFEEYLYPWFVSMNDLQTFPTKFEYFNTKVSLYIQPNSIQVYFDPMIMFEQYSKAYLSQNKEA
jgi:hypothetical protein